jgi:hypothetical protein
MLGGRFQIPKIISSEKTCLAYEDVAKQMEMQLHVASTNITNGNATNIDDISAARNYDQ